MTRTRRLTELMIRVYEKPKFTVDELAAEFGVSYRTMLRYLQELSGMGVPLYSEVGKHGGYGMLRSAPKAKPDRDAAGAPFRGQGLDHDPEAPAGAYRLYPVKK